MAQLSLVYPSMCSEQIQHVRKMTEPVAISDLEFSTRVSAVVYSSQDELSSL